MNRLQRALLIIFALLSIAYATHPPVPDVTARGHRSTIRIASGARTTISQILAMPTLPVLTDSTSTNTPHWVCIRRKESGGNYLSAGLEPHGGAYQFSVDTWQGLGFTGYPNQASPKVQDQAALKQYGQSGFLAWQTAPGCGL